MPRLGKAVFDKFALLQSFVSTTDALEILRGALLLLGAMPWKDKAGCVNNLVPLERVIAFYSCGCAGSALRA